MRSELARVEAQLLRREGQLALARDAGLRPRLSDGPAPSPGALSSYGLADRGLPDDGLHDEAESGFTSLTAERRSSWGSYDRLPGGLKSRDADGLELIRRRSARDTRDDEAAPRAEQSKPSQWPPTPHPRGSLRGDGDGRWGGGAGAGGWRREEENELRAQLTTMQVGRLLPSLHWGPPWSLVRLLRKGLHAPIGPRPAALAVDIRAHHHRPRRRDSSRR